jgi:uracil-DNA glycosylase
MSGIVFDIIGTVLIVGGVTLMAQAVGLVQGGYARRVGDSLEKLAAEVRGCTRCRLADERTHAVPGHGDPGADLMLVGEAPGAREDASGLPFQGLGGRFLDRQLAAVGVARDQVFVTSANKCRPPRNRTPKPDEIAACAGYLDRQLALVAPRVVLAMGGTAAARLHPQARGRALKVGEVRGVPVPLSAGRTLVVTYHPAAAMRFPAQREPFATDLAQAAHLAGLA